MKQRLLPLLFIVLLVSGICLAQSEKSAVINVS
jgi:hypothetical protein